MRVNNYLTASPEHLSFADGFSSCYFSWLNESSVYGQSVYLQFELPCQHAHMWGHVGPYSHTEPLFPYGTPILMWNPHSHMKLLFPYGTLILIWNPNYQKEPFSHTEPLFPNGTLIIWNHFPHMEPSFPYGTICPIWNPNFHMEP